MCGDGREMVRIWLSCRRGGVGRVLKGRRRYPSLLDGGGSKKWCGNVARVSLGSVDNA